ncbi:hypothetical protein Poli38472_004171 [Pythium oligandrum]|uniref:Kinesin light chain n=1 Tax=Pythium oligandrum TaxID=41045 RepID=A0A8K1FKT6_PYTOL|nr:hypothetical protein Poli38472_004171 [Pythium oligandrum]|eukprot:TMW66406.1 hypothetical protein Poli38472_004171 [Pythium oligandrum]
MKRFASIELLARRESLLAADPVAQRVVALTQLEDELTEETDALVRHELHALHAKMRLHGDTHAGLLITLDRLTERYRSTGRLAKALETAEREMSLTEALYGQSHLQTLTWLNNTAEILWLLGRLDESEDYFTQAHRGFVEQLGDSDLSTLQVLENLTLVCSQLGRVVDTERLLRELLRLLSAVYDDGSNERVLNLTMQLGSVVIAQRRINEALEIFTTCLHLTESIYGQNHSQVAVCHDQLGRCWFLLGNMEQAETAFLRSMQLVSSSNAVLSLTERQRLHNNLAMVAIAKRSHAAVVQKLQAEYQLDTGTISVPATYTNYVA